MDYVRISVYELVDEGVKVLRMLQNLWTKTTKNLLIAAIPNQWKEI